MSSGSCTELQQLLVTIWLVFLTWISLVWAGQLQHRLEHLVVSLVTPCCVPDSVTGQHSPCLNDPPRFIYYYYYYLWGLLVICPTGTKRNVTHTTWQVTICLFSSYLHLEKSVLNCCMLFCKVILLYCYCTKAKTIYSQENIYLV